MTYALIVAMCCRFGDFMEYRGINVAYLKPDTAYAQVYGWQDKTV